MTSANLLGFFTSSPFYATYLQFVHNIGQIHQSPSPIRKTSFMDGPDMTARQWRNNPFPESTLQNLTFPLNISPFTCEARIEEKGRAVDTGIILYARAAREQGTRRSLRLQKSPRLRLQPEIRNMLHKY